MSSNDKLTFSVPEAAEVLGISRALAYELVARKQLPAVRLGRRLLVPRHAIDTLLHQGGSVTRTNSSANETFNSEADRAHPRTRRVMR